MTSVPERLILLVALALPFLAYALWQLRRRLRNYEDDNGAPRRIPLEHVSDRCPACAGELIPARMDDDWGPQLQIASARLVKADGSRVFEPHP